MPSGRELHIPAEVLLAGQRFGVLPREAAIPTRAFARGLDGPHPGSGGTAHPGPAPKMETGSSRPSQPPGRRAETRPEE